MGDNIGSDEAVALVAIARRLQEEEQLRKDFEEKNEQLEITRESLSSKIAELEATLNVSEEKNRADDRERERSRSEGARKEEEERKRKEKEKEEAKDMMVREEEWKEAFRGKEEALKAALEKLEKNKEKEKKRKEKEATRKEALKGKE